MHSLTQVECESGTASSGSSLFGFALQARWHERAHIRNCETCKVGRPIPLEHVSKSWALSRTLRTSCQEGVRDTTCIVAASMENLAPKGSF
jgi:hypothetical protein